MKPIQHICQIVLAVEKKPKNAPEGVGNPEETLEIDLLTPLASVNMGSGSGPLLGKA